LLAIGAGALVLRQDPRGLFLIAFGILLAAGLGWVLVSSLWPAKVDRRCPSCGRTSVRAMRTDRLLGLECAGCGWRDEQASAFLWLEEHGPLEDVVLKHRSQRPR
jgi:hypothetical protein